MAQPQLAIKIIANTAELIANLNAGKGAIEAYGPSIAKMQETWARNGALVVEKAAVVTAAMKDISTSTLTAADAAKNLKTLDAGMAQLAASGKPIPPLMKETADKLRELAPPAEKSTDLFGKMKTAFLAAFTIGAIKGAVTSFLEFTGSLTDMAAKTGIGTTALQKLKFAAEQNGGTLEKVTSAIGKMGKALVEGNSGTVGAMTALGLSIEDVRNMDPATAFTTIGDAIAKVPSPLERSKLAMDLFGKSGAELLPMMTGNLTETMKAAEKLGIVLDEQTVAAGDDLGDTLSSLQSVGMAIIGKVLAPMLPAFQMVASAMLSAGKVVDVLRDAFDALVRMAFIAIKGIIDVAIKMGDIAGKIPGLSKVFGENATEMLSARDASVWLGGAIKGLEQGTQSATVATKAMHAPVGILTDEQLKAAKATDAHRKAIQGITADLRGDGAIKAARDMVAALKPIPDIHKLTEDAQAKVNKTMTAAIEVYRAQGKVAPEAMRMLWFETVKFPPVVSAFGMSVKNLGQQIDLVVPKMEKWGVETRSGIAGMGQIGTKIDLVPPKAREAVNSLEEMAKSLTQLAQVGGESFGALMQGAAAIVVSLAAAEKQNKQWAGSAGIASAMFSAQASTSEKWGSAIASSSTIASGAMNVWNASADRGSTSAGALHGAMAGAKAGAAFGPWGMAIGAAAGALIGFIKNLGKGRDEVVKFAAAFDTAAAGDGFDEMHAKLLTIGDAGEALWVKLTQGVGKNNPAEAKKVIEEINQALAGQDAWMQRLPELIEKYGLSWEQAGIQAKQAHLDEIARGLIQDFADLSKAGFDVATITGSMTTAINDYISQAIRTGTEIPAAMKPLLQKMIDMGVLTDETGLKLDDLEGLTFATTLTAGFASIVAAIQELTKALTGDLGGALEALSHKKVVIPIGFEMDPPPSGDPAFAATGGVVGYGKVIPFTRGGLVNNFAPVGTDTVPAMLTPGEIVINAAQQGRVASAIQGGGEVVSLAEVKAWRASQERMERLLRDQPRAIAIAVQDAVALARGSRR